MARAAVEVRRVTAEEIDVLGPVWDDLRATVGSSLALALGSLERLRERMTACPARGEFRVVVAFTSGEPVGFATLSVQDSGPWWEPPSVLVSLLHVMSPARHRGVGQALLAEAVALAEDVGTEDVAANVPPTLRDANRFFAKLGFSPYMTRRVASASALRRRLSTEPRGRVVDLRLRQRSLRERARRARRAPVVGVPAPEQP